MAAMKHNVLPVALVNMCGSDCTLQHVLCQTCSSKRVWACTLPFLAQLQTKATFLGQCPMTFADMKCKPTVRLHTTAKKAVYECCQACQNYWKGCLRFKYLSLAAKFRKHFEKPGIWPWKQHWKKFTLTKLLLMLCVCMYVCMCIYIYI